MKYLTGFVLGIGITMLAMLLFTKYETLDYESRLLSQERKFEKSKNDLKNYYEELIEENRQRLQNHRAEDIRIATKEGILRGKRIQRMASDSICDVRITEQYNKMFTSQSNTEEELDSVKSFQQILEKQNDTLVLELSQAKRTIQKQGLLIKELEKDTKKTQRTRNTNFERYPSGQLGLFKIPFTIILCCFIISGFVAKVRHNKRVKYKN
ncbi:MAG: hypothetical protein AAGG68_00380 [Bacteroidota bacterium]